MTRILNTGTPLNPSIVRIEGHYTVLMGFVVGVLFFLGLGVWQWHRGGEKEQLLASYALRQKAPPVTLSRIRDSKNLSDLPYYRAVLKGYFDEHRSLLLENQFYQHRVGYSVFTPFIVEPGQAILVYRGWLPMPEDRSRLPKIFTPTGIVTLTGTLWKSDPPRFHFGNEPTLPEKWPKRFQVLQWETLPPFPYAILPIGLWLDASLVERGELPREALRITTISPARHYGYAVLWVIIAIAFGVLCGYIVHGDNEK